MTEQISQYRSAVSDALGRVIPDEGELPVGDQGTLRPLMADAGE